MKLEKKKTVLNSLFNPQFNHCPLNWMLHICTNYDKISICMRCLWLIYSDNEWSYETLLEKDGSVFIRHKNILTLASEILKVKHDLYPEITSNSFTERANCHYNPQYKTDFRILLVKCFLHETESITYPEPKLCYFVSHNIKKSSVNSLRESIGKWVSTNNPCRICKV